MCCSCCCRLGLAGCRLRHAQVASGAASHLCATAGSLLGRAQAIKLKSSVSGHRHATSLPAACKPLPADQPREQDPHHWRGGQLDAAQHLGRRLPAGGMGWLACGGTAGCRRLAPAAAEQRALHGPVIMEHLSFAAPASDVQSAMPGFCFSVNTHRAFREALDGVALAGRACLDRV